MASDQVHHGCAVERLTLEEIAAILGHCRLSSIGLPPAGDVKLLPKNDVCFQEAALTASMTDMRAKAELFPGWGREPSAGFQTPVAN